MGSDGSSLHKGRGHTMRWNCLACLVLITVTGVHLLQDDAVGSSQGELRETHGQSITDVKIPLVKRDAEKNRDKKPTGGKKVGKWREKNPQTKRRKPLGKRKNGKKGVKGQKKVKGNKRIKGRNGNKGKKGSK